jgi:hypothetical protein
VFAAIAAIILGGFMFGAITAISAVSSAVGTSALIEAQTKNMSPEETRAYLDRLTVAIKAPAQEKKRSCFPWGFILGLVIGSSGN